MKTIREQLEEIWPAPECIQWNSNVGEYLPSAGLQASEIMLEKCVEWDARLDTFTRCQESQAIVTSLNDELVGALESIILNASPALLSDGQRDQARAVIAKSRSQNEQ